MKNLHIVVGMAMLATTQIAAQAAAPRLTAYARAERTIQDNARAVERNAAEYQYERIEIEVERIVVANKQIQKTLAAKPANTATAKALADAIRNLRCARFNSDMSALISASRDIEGLIAGLPTE